MAQLLKEISSLERTSRDFVTLIEHGPLSLWQDFGLPSPEAVSFAGGLIIDESALPRVCDSQKNRFEKVVKYYFPGDAAKSILEHH